VIVASPASNSPLARSKRRWAMAWLPDWVNRVPVGLPFEVIGVPMGAVPSMPTVTKPFFRVVLCFMRAMISWPT